MTEFAGSVVVVTGGTSGIGLETSLQFAKKGAQVFALGLSEVEPEVLPAEQSGSVEFIQADVTSASDMQSLAQQISNRHDHIGALVNAAGSMTMGNAIDTSIDQWNNSLAVNMTGIFNAAKALIPLMTQGGAIVNVSSVIALAAGKNRLSYAAAKAGVLGMTRAMALDHADQQIRVNAICPGAVETPMLHSAWEAVAPGVDQKIMRDALTKGTPLGRVAATSDIADLILFLCGSGSRFITGTILPVDGGITAQLAASQAK